MKPKNRIFTFSAVLFSLLLTNGNLAQSQVSPTTAPPPPQLSTKDSSQTTDGNWIGLASGIIVAVLGIGFGLVQFRKSQKLEQEKLEFQQRLEQEKLESQQKLEQEKLESQQKLEQEKLASQQKLEQEKLAWERERLTLEDEKLQLKYDLKLEQHRQEAELEKQLNEAETEEAAKHEAEAEAIGDRLIDEATEVYCEKVLADLRNEKILELKRQNLRQAD